jgi:hypothetical protein
MSCARVIDSMVSSGFQLEPRKRKRILRDAEANALGVLKCLNVLHSNQVFPFMKTASTLSTLAILALGALGTLPCLASEYRCCLPWDVLVVNEKGQPLANCTVVQEWGYSFGRNATNFTDQTVTDKSGRVRLPQRGVAYPISLGEQLAKRLTVQPGLGPWANIYVWKTGFEGQLVYPKHDNRVDYTTNGLFSRIVLRPPDKLK